MAKIDLVQTSLSQVSGGYTFQLHQNAQVNQNIKVLFVWSKKEAIPKDWISKLEFKFFEREKNMNNLEIKQQ